MIFLALITLLLSFYLLAVICEEFFVSSLDRIANRFKLPSDVAGATFMAVGSSAPELFTTLFAVFKQGGGHADVGAGTIVGSAIFNILVIIGVSSAFRRVKLTWQPILRDLIFYILTIIALLVVFWDGKIVIAESLLFLGMYVLYIISVVNWKKLFFYTDIDPIDIIESSVKKSQAAQFSKKLLSFIIPDPEKKPKAYLGTFGLSIAFIATLSYLLVESAVILGSSLGISPTIIALTVLAAGTSIPDLFSSIIVAKQGRGDMAVSNAIGSNVFDVLFALGFPWLLLFLTGAQSIAVSTENLMSSVFLLFATVVAVVVLFVVRKWTIGRRAGFFLLGIYGLYLFYMISQVL